MMRHEAIASSATYSRSGQLNDLDQLIVDHRDLVRRTAWYVHSRMSSAIEIEELMQVGLIALIEAARGFEDRGIPFKPYAAMRIRGAMIDELRRLSKMGRTAAKDRKLLSAARGRLEQRHMRAPTDAEMAEELGMAANAYYELASTAQQHQYVSMDDAYADTNPCFADEEDSADISLEKAGMTQLLGSCVTRLPEREALILNLYFVEEMNLHEIGELMSLTSARICQIKATALAKLKIWMEEVVE